MSYTTKSVNDNFYLCANGINDGEYAFNNLQMYDGTWYHKFRQDLAHGDGDVCDVPEGCAEREWCGAAIAPEKGTNGANCGAGEQRCFAPEWAVVNYINKELAPHDFVSLRTDFLNDKKGQRTGYATKYSEETLC